MRDLAIPQERARERRDLAIPRERVRCKRMALLSKLLVALGLDSSDYAKGLDDAEKKASTSTAAIGKKLEGIGDSMTRAGKTMTAGITVPLVAMGALSLDAASDLEESMNKVNVVFGKSAGEIQAWAKTAAESLGMSTQQALEAAGTFGNLFTAMGMGQGPAA